MSDERDNGCAWLGIASGMLALTTVAALGLSVTPTQLAVGRLRAGMTQQEVEKQEPRKAEG
jgi:hypothetical protein